MKAVLRTGGKQYQVSEGDVLAVEKLVGEPGAAVEFTDVLLLENDDAVLVAGELEGKCLIKATIQAQAKAPKIIVFKFKRRKNYRRKQGHRQAITKIKIDAIEYNA